MESRRIAVSGAGGLVGSALLAELPGATVLRLARPGTPGSGTVLWDWRGGRFDAARLEGCDAVVHLAGEPIASRRWSASQKEKILSSRVLGTRVLVDGLAGLSRPPRVLVSASAVGFYGSRGDEELTETSPPGRDFLAEVVKGWEGETMRATGAGIRAVCLRFGMILSARGGALAKMLTPFRLGAGGRLGDGRQWMSWIHISDVVAAIRLAMDRDELEGPLNTVAPEPVRNADFTRTLGRVLRRPALLPAPRFALRLALGEMADALLLSSQRALPARLRQAGHVFRFPTLEPALRDLLG